MACADMRVADSDLFEFSDISSPSSSAAARFWETWLFNKIRNSGCNSKCVTTMDSRNPHMTSLLILKNNKFSDWLNINEIKI